MDGCGKGMVIQDSATLWGTGRMGGVVTNKTGVIVVDQGDVIAVHGVIIGDQEGVNVDWGVDSVDQRVVTDQGLVME